jgi:hypothetical protein
VERRGRLEAWACACGERWREEGSRQWLEKAEVDEEEQYKGM